MSAIQTDKASLITDGTSSFSSPVLDLLEMQTFSCVIYGILCVLALYCLLGQWRYKGVLKWRKYILVAISEVEKDWLKSGYICKAGCDKCMDKMNKRRRMLIVSIIMIGTILIMTGLTYLVVNWGCLGLNQESNEWIGFFGGIFGAIIGGMISLYILYDTRKLTIEDRKEDRANNVIPIIDAYHLDGAVKELESKQVKQYDYIYWQNEFGLWLLNDPQHESVKREMMNKFNTELVMRNIGRGPMLELDVTIVGKDSYKSKQKVSLAVDDILIYHIYIDGELLICGNDNNRGQYGNKVVFEFKDVFGNKYKQSINFGINKFSQGYQLTNFDYISIIDDK